MLPLSDRSTVTYDLVQTLPAVLFQTISLIYMWHVKHRCHDPRCYGFWCSISVSCEPMWYSVSTKVHANVFVSPPWLLGQQGKAPPENLWKMHAEVSNNFMCIKYVPTIFDDKSKVSNLKQLYDMYMQKCIFYTTRNTSILRSYPVITAKEKIK